MILGFNIDVLANYISASACTIFIFHFFPRREVSGGCVEVGEELKMQDALAHSNRPQRCFYLILQRNLPLFACSGFLLLLSSICSLLLTWVWAPRWQQGHCVVGLTRGGWRFCCKAAPYIPLKGLCLRLCSPPAPSSPCRPSSGFTEQNSCTALTGRLGLCELDGSRK